MKQNQHRLPFDHCLPRERKKNNCFFGFFISTALANIKMELLSTLVKSTIPNYLSGLPIPNTFGGWFKLGCK